MAECRLEIPKVEGLEDNVLTVGREFFLDCRGEFQKIERLDDWKFSFSDPQMSLGLHLLRSEFVTKENIKFVVTSYRPGPHSFSPLQLKKSEDVIDLGKVNFEVQSVIQAQEATVEPFGPMAIGMGWPMKIWAALGLIVVLLAVLVFVKLRRHMQKKTLLEELSRHDSSATPLAEVHQHYRKWRREHAFFYSPDLNPPPVEINQVLAEVNQAFRIYLIRAFKIPALQWSDRLILRELKKYHRVVYDLHGKNINKFLIEIEKAKTAGEKLKDQDVVQLTENLRILAESLDASKKGDKK